MAEFFNITSNTVVGGTDEADNIQNIYYNNVVAINVTIQGNGGDDDVTNAGDYASILGGDGNDKITNSGANNVTILAGSGNDDISNVGGGLLYNSETDVIDTLTANNVYVDAGEGDDNISNANSADNITINGGTGNDEIIGYGTELFSYNLGDGNDIIYGYTSADTLNITGASYSSVESGNDIIVTVGEGTDSVGTITLIDAAGNTVNITGGTTETVPADSGTTETVSAGPSANATNATDYVFIFDTSGSMDTYINRVKDISANFTQQLVNNGVDYRLGIVEYESTSEIQTYGFTTDLNEFSTNVSTIADKATDIYRWEEYGLTAIETALAMDYREGADKKFILLTDEGYMENDYSSATLDSTTVIANLNSNSVMLDVIGKKDSGSYYSCEDEWTPIAQATGGDFYDINGDYNSIFTSIAGGSDAPSMHMSRWSYEFTFPESTSDAPILTTSV